MPTPEVLPPGLTSVRMAIGRGDFRTAANDLSAAISSYSPLTRESARNQIRQLYTQIREGAGKVATETGNGVQSALKSLQETMTINNLSSLTDRMTESGLSALAQTRESMEKFSKENPEAAAVLTSAAIGAGVSAAVGVVGDVVTGREMSFGSWFKRAIGGAVMGGLTASLRFIPQEWRNWMRENIGERLFPFFFHSAERVTNDANTTFRAAPTEANLKLLTEAAQNERRRIGERVPQSPQSTARVTAIETLLREAQQIRVKQITAEQNQKNQNEAAVKKTQVEAQQTEKKTEAQTKTSTEENTTKTQIDQKEAKTKEETAKTSAETVPEFANTAAMIASIRDGNFLAQLPPRFRLSGTPVEVQDGTLRMNNKTIAGRYFAGFSGQWRTIDFAAITRRGANFEIPEGTTSRRVSVGIATAELSDAFASLSRNQPYSHNVGLAGIELILR